MVILVLNCGSSSIKYQVIDMEDASSKLLAKGIVERIGLPEGDLTHKPVGKEPFELHQPIPDHTTGIKLVLDALPANLEGVLSIEKVLPGVKQVTVFDTSFHQSIPAVNYMYALPHAYYEKYRVRKYGFHGTSHKYVAKVGAELAGLDFHNSRIITCHIGNGGSVTAILNGKSYDTSMGFSPLDGLVMGTRCGQVDASAITFIGEKEGMSYAELNTMMNKKSGVQGLTDISSDMRDIDRAYDEGNPRAILARDMYYGRIKKFIGEYAAEMGGVDMIIFTGGVGENSCEMREAVCTGLEFMGVKFDPAANKGARGVNKILSAADSKVKVATIATNEELVIATDTYNLVK